MRNILILGNGFDLDLGLKTKYSDFTGSDEWRKYSSEKSTLFKYLNAKKEVERWFDLESELFNYANPQVQKSRTIKEDKLYFDQLHEGLKNYLRNQQDKDINIKSYAAELLKAIVHNDLFHNIYSFNYTDINIFAKQIGITLNSKCTYIHGSLAENSIILGVNDKRLIPNYDFLHKTMSPYYRSHNLFEDLYAANEVIFFGLSFGEIDFTYFEDFFKSQSSGDNVGRKKKNITIITYDENSRRDILRKLNNQGINRQRLYAQSNFQMIRTSVPDDMVLFNELFDRLKKNCRKKIDVAMLVG